MGGRLGKKLFEVFQEIRGCVKQGGDLRIDVLDGFLFTLVRLKNLQELFVDFGFVLESILNFVES